MNAELSIELELLKRRYIQELNDLYTGELERLSVLPAMAEIAQRPAVKSAFQYHFEKTKAHVERLKQVFATLGYRYRPVTLKRPGAPASHDQAGRLPKSLLAECDEVLIVAARTMEQHEISSYLLAINYAQILRDHTVAYLLEQTLNEEYEADQILAGLEETANRPERIEDTAVASF